MAHNSSTDKDFCEYGAFTKPTVETIDFYWGAVKITSDGSNQGLTGYQQEPYKCPPYKYGYSDFLCHDADTRQIPWSNVSARSPPNISKYSVKVCKNDTCLVGCWCCLRDLFLLVCHWFLYILLPFKT